MDKGNNDREDAKVKRPGGCNHSVGVIMPKKKDATKRRQFRTISPISVLCCICDIQADLGRRLAYQNIIQTNLRPDVDCPMKVRRLYYKGGTCCPIEVEMRGGLPEKEDKEPGSGGRHT